MNRFRFAEQPSPFRWLAAVTASLLIFALVSPEASAQRGGSISSADELRTVNSRFYVIHSDLPADVIRTWGQHMDIVYQAYGQMFRGMRPRERNQRQNLYLLATREGYIQTLSRFGIDGSNSGGMFFYGPRGRGLATFIGERSDLQIQHVLQHEGFHQFAANYFGQELPLWANEGLAEYFGNSLVVQGSIRRGMAPPRDVMRLRRAIEAGPGSGVGRLLDFSELLDITSATWHGNMADPSKGPMQYLQSWSVVHFLVHAENGRYQNAFSNYLRILSEGQSHDTAFERAFGTTDRRAFESRWRTYLQEGIEPDVYTETLEKLDFIAAGITFLYNRSDPAARGSLETVRDRLIEIGFRRTEVSEGQSRVVSAEDEGMFTFTDDRGNDQSFVQQESNPRNASRRGAQRPAPSRRPVNPEAAALAGQDAGAARDLTSDPNPEAAPDLVPGLPRSISAPGLRPLPTVVFAEVDGTLNYRVSYGR